MNLFAAIFPNFNLIQLIIIIIPLLFAVTIHEVAHGYIALKLGDSTAKRAGRLTLNPLKHLDPFGSFILPLALQLSGSPVVFGYAKPVPVNFSSLKNFRSGTILVAAAGAFTNLLFAFISGGIFQIINHFKPLWYGLLIGPAMLILLKLFAYSAIINLVLAFFNLIPIPPLDGGRILTVLLPVRIRQIIQHIEPLGFLILIVLLFTDMFNLFISFFITPLVRLLLQG